MIGKFHPRRSRQGWRRTTYIGSDDYPQPRPVICSFVVQDRVERCIRSHENPILHIKSEGIYIKINLLDEYEYFGVL